ncbi:hypothetical protein ACFYZN_25405 [Streptomyces sp. NPDC001777]|uniref:hypothetical protein n=1 Tax=Streptomyces sp. NPDC001777 TaxID=3364608 RepID=UPI00367487B9
MTPETTTLTRRGLLLSAAALGIGTLAACTGAAPQDSETPAPTGSSDGPSGPSGGAVDAQGDLYGVGIYNTQQVADELAWIQQNVQPLDGGDHKRILITGSTGGAGQIAAAHLLKRGHAVVAHARNAQPRRRRAPRSVRPGGRRDR